MNFTRDPIIETIISAKDGHKLLLKNSKGSTGTEYTVEAVEVVSFGSALFYRSLERPQSFIVPVTDYEVSEVREGRISLKNAKVDKSIKIESSNDSSKIKKKSEDEPKKGRKRTRKKKGEKTPESATPSEEETETPPPAAEQKKEEKPLANPEASSAVLTQLFPPPSSLISETMTRIEPKDLEPGEATVAADTEVEEKKLDHIWTVDTAPEQESSSSDQEPSTAEKPAKKSPRKRVKKEAEKVEKEIEENVPSSTVVIEDPQEPKPE